MGNSDFGVAASGPDLTQLIVTCQRIENKVDGVVASIVAINQKLEELNKKVTEATTS